MTLESHHEKTLKVRVEKAGGLCIKLPAILYRGIPDRLVLLPRGRVWFLELKKDSRAKTGESTKVHQDKFAELLKRLGMNHKRVEGAEGLEEWFRLVGV